MVRSLVTWTPRFPRSLEEAEGDFSRMMDRLWGTLDDNGFLAGKFSPRTNIAENENSFEISVELPGMKRDDFSVEVHEGELWITGEKKEEKEEKGKTYHRIERHHGEFRRVIPLPSTANRDQVEAKYNDGVLMVKIPKVEESKPKHIEVKA